MSAAVLFVRFQQPCLAFSLPACWLARRVSLTNWPWCVRCTTRMPALMHIPMELNMLCRELIADKSSLHGMDRFYEQAFQSDQPGGFARLQSVCRIYPIRSCGLWDLARRGSGGVWIHRIQKNWTQTVNAYPLIQEWVHGDRSHSVNLRAFGSESLRSRLVCC